MYSANKAWAAPLLSLALLQQVPTSALAGPADYVYLPNVVEGEREIDFMICTAK